MSSKGKYKNGAEYLQAALGDSLAKALASVARERPEDPVKYVADFLRDEHERIQKHGHNDDDDDDDSGHGRDVDYNNDDSRGSIPLPDSVQVTKNRFNKNKNQDSSLSSTADSSVILSSNNSKSSRSKDRRSRRRRRRTAQSEPSGKVTSKTSLTYYDKRSSQKGYREPRARSLTTAGTTSTLSSSSPSSLAAAQDRLKFSRKTPLAALPPEEYKLQRGLKFGLKLPPMQNSKRDALAAATFANHYNGRRGSDGDDPISAGIDGKPKPKQLQPLLGMDKFDWQRHLKKNKKMLKDTRNVANMI